MRSALRRKNGIKLTFVFDAWETTSSSSFSVHLSGHSVVTCVCVVRGISRHEGILEIKATCLAMGTGFGPERPRPGLRSAIVPETGSHEDLEDFGHDDMGDELEDAGDEILTEGNSDEID